jgi:Rap guanine nucleotide exchange factor 2
MRTKCDDCQFVCVTQTDYFRILHQGEENQKRHVDDVGRLVLVTEHRSSCTAQAPGGVLGPGGHIVIRGTPEKLMTHLMDDNSSTDATFVEDFLLTYRTYLPSPTTVMRRLLEWFREPSLRDKVTRVLLLWVNNHFTDFETDPAMMELLERFEALLESEKMHGQLRMLNFACAAKARRRTVTLTRPSRDEPLQFSVLGGYERGFGIFVSRVEKGSKADEIGLKRGDQILEVNGQSFEHVIKLARALEVLRSVCHLSITVKSNLLAFNEMLHTSDDTPRVRCRGKSVGSPSAGNAVGNSGGSTRGAQVVSPVLPGLADQRVFSGSESVLSFTSSVDGAPAGRRSQAETATSAQKPKVSVGAKDPMVKMGSKSRLNRAFNRFLHKPKSLINMDISSLQDEAGGITHSSSGGNLYPPSSALSNPDLTRNAPFEDAKSEFPEHVLKVYKVDQTFKYLLVNKETTAHEVVMLSLQEFGMTESSSNFSLCEVSVAEGGFVKQRRLPDTLQNLAERIGLASRYYVKNVQSSESLLPDEAIADLTKEALVNMLQLNPVEVATQLMVEDFTIFRQIEAIEYVDDLFESK